MPKKRRARAILNLPDRPQDPLLRKLNKRKRTQLQVQLQGQGARAEKADQARRAKARKDAERLAHLLANPKT